MPQGDINVNPGLTTVNNKIPLKTLPFYYNFCEPTMPSECEFSDYSKEHDGSNFNILRKKGLQILHLNIISLPLKIAEIRFIAKQSNVLIIRISESKLDLSILNCEIDVVGYVVIRTDHSRRSDKVACYVKNSLSYNHNSIFCPNIESIFIDIFLPESKPSLVGVLH